MMHTCLSFFRPLSLLPVLLLSAFSAGLVSCNDTGSTSTGSSPRTRVYATFISHNERSPHAECDPVTIDQSGYYTNRAVTLKFAQMIVEHQAAWDMQSDYAYLDAVKNWDSAEVMASTDGRNLISYLADLAPERIVLDAHGHTEDGPNYADISYMHEALGASRNGVVGGIISFPAYAEDWTSFEYTVSGRVFPDVRWTADILWGAGALSHQGLESTAAGIWRPKSADDFYADEPSRRLAYIGSYRGTASGLGELLDKLHAGQLENNRMYTAAIFINQCTLTDEAVQQMADVIDLYAADAASGDLVWVTLPEAARIWRDEYASTPVIYLPE